jgi:esterase/lipase superfamily enzyme
MPDFILCTRAISKEKFTDKPGPSKYLAVPDGAEPQPDHAVNQANWAKTLIAAAAPNGKAGNLLIFIHGYNNTQDTVMSRHRQLKADLAKLGFIGTVASYDWPSGDTALAYLEDREHAKKTALQLVSDGIALLAKSQSPDCPVTVHLLAHSTGAFLVREAFDEADDRVLDNNSWVVSQLAFISGDISSSSMSVSASGSESLYRHCVRMTNYFNRHDEVLAISNVKRVGVSPRVGRVGLPADAPSKAINVDCSDYFHSIHPDGGLTISHSWQFGDPVFTRDLLSTLNGVDRNAMATRKVNGTLVLTATPKP